MQMENWKSAPEIEKYIYLDISNSKFIIFKYLLNTPLLFKALSKNFSKNIDFNKQCVVV